MVVFHRFKSEGWSELAPLHSTGICSGHHVLWVFVAPKVSSTSEISRRKGAIHNYVARHINLTLLAPDIVAAILDEELPDGARLHALLAGIVGEAAPPLGDRTERPLR